MTEYKQTINLPATDFPMKADLARREPEFIKNWEQRDIYGQLRKLAKGRPTFILPDGPPYANGAIHLGHALDKTIKDIVIKSRSLDGFDAPFIPGWDCHGLPIEHQIEKTRGKEVKSLEPAAFRRACREYAQSQIDVQRADFIRLGVLADWSRPYATMQPEFEAEQLRAFAQILRNGHVYKGAKPVHWCLDCRSALAEAEVEYEEKTSPAIDVRFLVIDPADVANRFGLKVAPASPINFVIWTTTPWTLPANQAVALNADFQYALIDVGGEHLVLAVDLAAAVLKRAAIEGAKTVATAKGAVLEGIKLAHPFYERIIPTILGDHVTAEAGTGAVHTAPGHGQEDFAIGLKYKLLVDNPVGSDGRFVEGTLLFAGEKVFDANQHVIEVLKERGRLLKQETLRHSYPHCWRHKSPVIFRATAQWFISMEQAGLRAEAFREIGKVKWMPAWGESRIGNMVADRPDWCISRQRMWGVPLALFTHRVSGQLHPKSPELLERVAERVQIKGIEAWFELDSKELLGAEAEQYEKVNDIMDVWFDSGVIHHCLAKLRPEMTAPADLYSEGSDQHRGWFQSSLLTSAALYKRAPYRAVITHGFTVDDKGRKMSKSLGNVIVPQKVINAMGADVLRLWVAATDYANEMSLSDEILKRVSESYRRMRNTARYFLGNLYDFNPAKDSIEIHKMTALDRWAVWRVSQLQQEVQQAYREYQFIHIYQKVHNFCSGDMGAFYLDVLKDRLYCMRANSAGRRSAQTAMYYIVEAMVRWLAPILSFTAEEIWKFLPGERAESVFLASWFEVPAAAHERPNIDWDKLLELRSAVSRELEKLRVTDAIGAPLDAEVDVYCAPALFDTVRQVGDELRFIFITSYARLHRADARPSTAVPANTGADNQAWIVVGASAHGKCVRCRHKRDDVGKHAQHAELCGRCVSNVDGPGESREYA